MSENFKLDPTMQLGYIPSGTIVKIDGIPFELVMPTAIYFTKGNDRLIETPIYARPDGFPV